MVNDDFHDLMISFLCICSSLRLNYFKRNQIQIMLVLVACLIFFIQIALNQELLILNTDQNVLMYNGESINTIFELKYNNFDCSAYVYSFAQTQESYTQNLPINLEMQNVGTLQAIDISTVYNHFTPSLNQYFCSQNSCKILIYHNCPQELTSTNYFDIVQLNIKGIGFFFYYLNCNSKYNPIFIEWSQVAISICATIILLFASIFSRLRSFGNFAINYNIACIIVVVSLLLIFGMLQLFIPQISNVILQVLSWICGTISVSIVVIQTLFFFFQHSCLKQGFSVGRFKIRIMDVIGFICGLGSMFAWWYTHKNWIISDCISICMVVSFIKIFKFVSFKIALLSYFLVLVIVTIGDVLSVLLNQLNFQIYFLFSNNNPFIFQIPVFIPTYSLKCSWISIASIFLPGLLVSYLRRFDRCRSTNIYLITTVITYFIGSILWNVINVFSNTPIPFDAIVEPIMISSFCLFARTRKELRTIWEGTFYDQEFVHRIQIEMIGKSLQVQTPKQDMLRDSIANNLFFNIYEDQHFQKLDKVKGELILNDQL